jgi:hypothetical protein
MTKSTCPACHGGGYIADGDDEVAPCDHPDCTERGTRPINLADFPDSLIPHLSAEVLYRSLPVDDTAAEQVWCRTIGRHMTREQHRAVQALVNAEPKRPRREWPRHYEYRWKVSS